MGDINRLLLKILVEIFLILLLGILFLTSKNNVVNAREKLLDIQNYIDITVIEQGDYKYLFPVSDEEIYSNYTSTILEVTNKGSDKINYNLVLKMNKIRNMECYKIMLLGNVYRLDEIKYYEDEQYRYFILGNYLIGNRNQNFTFILWKFIENNNSDDINYSFLIEEV